MKIEIADVLIKIISMITVGDQFRKKLTNNQKAVTCTITRQVVAKYQKNSNQVVEIAR